MRVVYNLINDIVSDIPHDLLDHLFSKITEVGTNKFSEMHLTFLKDFTSCALLTHNSNDPYFSDDDKKLQS